MCVVMMFFNLVELIGKVVWYFGKSFVWSRFFGFCVLFYGFRNILVIVRMGYLV